MWDAATGERRFSLDGGWSSEALRSARQGLDLMWPVLKSNREIFSPDGHRFAHQAAAQAWIVDTATGETLLALPGRPWWSSGPRHSDILHFGDAMVFDPRGRRALNAHLLWNADTGELVRELDGEARVFSPDGSRFAGLAAGTSASLGELVVWDAATGAELVRSPYGVRGAQEFNLRFSPHGDRVALTSVNESWVKVWNAQTGDLVATLCCPANPYQAVFSPAGRRILTQSQQDGLGVWNLDGHELVNLTPATTPYTVAWSPDGRVIAAALEDGSIQLWEAHPWGEG